jgi:uncharacterized membrane protein YhhN
MDIITRYPAAILLHAQTTMTWRDLTRASDWLVSAALVWGIVADRLDSRPYVSELQDFFVAASVRLLLSNNLWC